MIGVVSSGVSRDTPVIVSTSHDFSCYLHSFNKSGSDPVFNNNRGDRTNHLTTIRIKPFNLETSDCHVRVRVSVWLRVLRHDWGQDEVNKCRFVSHWLN